MTFDELLAELNARDIQLRRNGQELLVLGDQELLDPSLLSELSAHKRMLLELLGNDNDTWWSFPIKITPEMLPLVQLTQEEIERIANKVPGGAANVQDIYPLAPLQEGILFHHLMGGEDPYVLGMQLSFQSRERLDAYIEAMQSVIERHDIFRTAVAWEDLKDPVQVVWRRCVLRVEQVEIDESAGDAAGQMFAGFHPQRTRIDLRQAPLMRIAVAEDKENRRWLMMFLLHHLAGDHTTLQVMQEEIQAYLLGCGNELPVPVPYRNLVAQARLGITSEGHESFFRKMLGDVEDSTAPFGLLEVRGSGREVEEARMLVQAGLQKQIREQARKSKVSVATIFHVAWALLLAQISEREDVVFGTVLLGRTQGEERAMGLYMNTLPVRINIGKDGAAVVVARAHRMIAELLRHEHARLALAQRCSNIAPPVPLFTSLLNYRHSQSAVNSPSAETGRGSEGIEVLHVEERTNYPILMSVDSLDEGSLLTAQVPDWIGAKRVCEYLVMALESLVMALESSPSVEVRTLKRLPEAERKQVLYEWNSTKVKFARGACLHELFEMQVHKTPERVAAVFGETALSYAELNRRANRLAHDLLERGVKPDARVGICVERGLEMLVGVLGILKAGGAYVPLDPGYPAERVRYMLEDSGSVALVTQSQPQELFKGVEASLPVVNLESLDWRLIEHPCTNPKCAHVGLTQKHLAYVIYTSGSTGKPKGVGIEHRSAVNFIRWALEVFAGDVFSETLFSTSLNFDLSVFECCAPISVGGTVRIVSSMMELLQRDVKVTLINTVPSAMAALLEANKVPATVRVVNLAGELLKSSLVERLFAVTGVESVCNLYGPTEATTYSTWVPMRRSEGFAAHIGRPIANTRVYILNREMGPVPVGVVGELYIGGEGLARGYVGRADLTAERFLPDPYVDQGKTSSERMYRTGDLGRWQRDGQVEFLGRNDSQVKVRGYRIELGEIEAKLEEYEGMKEAVVVAREEGGGEKRLVAYYTVEEKGTGERGTEIGAEELRGYLAARLPGYMVPGAYVRLESMPLTVNGKLDRKRLPAPEGDAYGVRGYEALEGEIETAVAAIWAELLKVERVGRQDNFFQLGGHSLLAMQLISRIRATLNVELQLKDIFVANTVEDMAAILSSQIALNEILDDEATNYSFEDRYL